VLFRSDHGAREIYVVATHAILSGPAYSRLAASPIRETIVTNTIALNDKDRPENLTVLSMAPLISEAIYRIYNEIPVSSLFE